MKYSVTILLWISLLAGGLALQAQDTLLIYKLGTIVDKVPLLDIDSFSFVNSSVVYDIEGNGYTIVNIGSKKWMKENLRTTKFNNGVSIPVVTDNTTWSTLQTPAYCWHKNDSLVGKTYGALYNWYAAKELNICPTGWHVSTNNDWKALYDSLGGINVAAPFLKEAGLAHWKTPNDGTDSIGFTALPGNQRYESGSFNNLGVDAYWWLPNEQSATNGNYRSLEQYSIAVKYASPLKTRGLSIRCVKD